MTHLREPQPHALAAPGVEVLFRDYGRNDHTQLRFARAGDAKIGDHFYRRRDGTRTYFFSVEDVIKVFTSAGLTVVSASYVCREIVNRKDNLRMQRVFVQAKFVR